MYSKTEVPQLFVSLID